MGWVDGPGRELGRREGEAMGTRLVVPWEQRIRFGLSDKHERAFENLTESQPGTISRASSDFPVFLPPVS